MPAKAAYLRLENDPSYLFLFQLAEHLHKSVAEIRQLDELEIIGWNRYLLRKEQQRQIAKGGGTRG